MATTINSGDEKKFISLANLKNFKIKADDNYIKASARAAKNGVASLDENGRIPITQLGNLDTSLFILATELPKDNIKSNKIYLIESTNKGADNEYTEYVYVDSAWEKLGEYKANVDLDPYLTKTDASTTYLTINSAKSTYQPKGNYLTSHQDISGKLDKTVGVTKVDIDSTNLSYTVDNEPAVVTIPVATKNTSGSTGGHNGFMTAEQATALDNATSNITTINGTLSGKADNSTVNSLKSTVDALSTTVGNHTDSIGSINTTLGSKVDKVTGKGLSTNDYTTAEKNKLANAISSKKFKSIVNKNSSLTINRNQSAVNVGDQIYYEVNENIFLAKKTVNNADTYYTHFDGQTNYNDYSKEDVKTGTGIKCINGFYIGANNELYQSYNNKLEKVITSGSLSISGSSFTKTDTNVNLNLRFGANWGTETNFNMSFPMASDSQAGAITKAQFNAFTAATKAVTTTVNGLMLSDDKNKLDRLSDLKHITISQLDKCGYTTEGDLVKDVAKYGELKFYVTDAAAVVTCTTDASRHAIFQTITTHNVLDISSTGVVTLSNTTHKDGILFTYQRYFAFSGGTYANLNKWTYWYVLDINGYAPTALPTDSAVYKANYTSVFKDIAATTDSTKKVSLNSIRISKDGTLATNTLLESASEQEIKDIFK